MMRAPGPLTVTLVTPLKNERDNIEQLWAAILGQSRPPDEWIITDNGSTDGTFEWLEANCPSSGFPVKVIPQPNKTIAAMMNGAIRLAKCELIACCHGGTRIPRDWLQNLLRPFDSETGIDAVAGLFEPAGVTRFEKWVARYQRRYAAEPDPHTYLPASRSLAFTKDLWGQVGGFPEWLPRFGEDTLFGIRVRAAGNTVALAPDAIVEWRPKSSPSGLLRQERLYSEANGLMGLGRVGLRYLFRPWLIVVASAAVGLLLSSWVAAIGIGTSLVLLDYLRCQRARRGLTIAEYFFFLWIVRTAKQVGLARGGLLRRYGGLGPPPEDQVAVQWYRVALGDRRSRGTR